MVQLKIIILFLAHRNRNKLIEATRHHGFRSWHCLLPRPPESHPCQKPLHNCRLETFTKAFTLASAKPSISKTSACVIGDRLPLLVRTLVLRALPSPPPLFAKPSLSPSHQLRDRLPLSVRTLVLRASFF